MLIGEDASKEVTWLEYIDSYYNNIVETNSTLEPATKTNYRKAINHMKAFLSLCVLNTVRLNMIDIKFALSFKDYCLNDIPKIKKVGMCEASALGIIKKFRTICARAIDEKGMESNPFSAVRLRNKNKPKERLTVSEVKTLYNLNFSTSPKLAVYRDIFMFMVFTGFSYKDAMGLTTNSVIHLTDKLKMIKVFREKTSILVESVMVKHALEIIDKYANLPERELYGVLLPRRSNTKINDMLKVIAERANISRFSLTSNIGRHTFRQLLGEAKIVEPGVIKRLMGHTTNSDIDGTYYSITEGKLIEAKNRFEIFLDKKLRCND